MKITNKDGKVYEGTANELANYFKGMTYRKTKKVKKDTTAPPSQTELDIYVVERDAANTIWKNTPKLKKRISSTGKFPRARWNRYEDAFLEKCCLLGWKTSKTTNALNRLCISEIKRTPGAVAKRAVKHGWHNNHTTNLT